MLWFSLGWSPVLLLAALAVGWKRPALELSIVGVLYTLLLVVFGFDTPLAVALRAAVDGVLTTLPLLLVVLAGILLTNLMQAAGSLPRLVEWLSGGVRNTYHREILITLGVGNFMEGAGVIAEPVTASMLRAAGVEPTGAAALSIIGYSGLMTLELAGIIVTVLSLVTGIPVRELGVTAAWLCVPATVMMAACIPRYLPGSAAMPHRFFLPLASGLFVGMAALASALFIGVPLSGMLGGLALIVVLILIGARRLAWNRQLARDMSPFLFVLATLLSVNTIPLLKDLTFNRWTLTLRIMPVHTVTLQPFFSPYLYLFAACGITLLLFRFSSWELCAILGKTAKSGLRALAAMGLFGAMGQMIAYSGYSADFAELHTGCNIPWLLAHGLETYSGRFYPIFVPLLGWVGTFLTGYGVASLMLFGHLQVEAARLMGVSATWMAAGLAVGASLGSISSPFKIAIAAPLCDALGKEGEILRFTVPWGIASSLLLGMILWILIYFL